MPLTKSEETLLSGEGVTGEDSPFRAFDQIAACMCMHAIVHVSAHTCVRAYTHS